MNHKLICKTVFTLAHELNEICLFDSKPSFSSAEHVIKYLGQYTHRVAISNHHIINISKDSVQFIYKDSGDHRKVKP
ncbi:MAG: transposase, partial [Bacteroidales bacterium]|nr:transposase [Bacteroidales bacterium]